LQDLIALFFVHAIILKYYCFNGNSFLKILLTSAFSNS